MNEKETYSVNAAKICAEICAKILKLRPEELLGQSYIFVVEAPQMSMSSLVSKTVKHYKAKEAGSVETPMNGPRTKTCSVDKLALISKNFIAADEDVEFSDSVNNYRDTLHKTQQMLLSGLWFGFSDKDLMDICGITKRTLGEYKLQIKKGLRNAILR